VNPAYAYGVTSDRERILTELNRTTTRISGLNPTRLEPCAVAIHSCAQQILDLTPGAHPQLPVIGLSGANAQLTVISRDYLELTESANLYTNDSVVAELLTQLRRDLP
jgi:hypothetical protein